MPLWRKHRNMGKTKTRAKWSSTGGLVQKMPAKTRALHFGYRKSPERVSRVEALDWSRWRESNPRFQLGKLTFCHWTTPALWISLLSIAHLEGDCKMDFSNYLKWIGIVYNLDTDNLYIIYICSLDFRRKSCYNEATIKKEVLWSMMLQNIRVQALDVDDLIFGDSGEQTVSDRWLAGQGSNHTVRCGFFVTGLMIDR